MFAHLFKGVEKFDFSIMLSYVFCDNSFNFTDESLLFFDGYCHKY